VLDLPATPRLRHVRAAGCDVNVVEWGEPGRPPLLLLHGGMAHARWWDFVAARLADRLHVLAVDLPGHGDSPWIEPSRYVHVEVPVIRELLATLAPGPWSLGGHSNGGLLAVVTATEGTPLARLVAVDIPLDPSGDRLVRSGKGFRRMPQPAWTSREEGVASFRLFPKDGDVPVETLRYIGAHSVREDGNGTWTSKFDWRYFRGRDPNGPNPYAAFPERLRRIPCPTLLVRGGNSSILGADDYAEMLSRIPRVTGVVVAGSGHNPHVERPAETAEAIAAFVRD